MSCIVLKCVTQLLQEHQARASFRSHASKTLSRNIDQLVRDIYNYFSKLAKQTNEFKEFQDFTDIPKHQILKFITFTGCHWGYLWGELWKNGHLSLFFQGQYLINRIQVSEKIAVELGCIFNMFYFTDCVPNITDNLNTVFQSSNPTIQCMCWLHPCIYVTFIMFHEETIFEMHRWMSLSSWSQWNIFSCWTKTNVPWAQCCKNHGKACIQE